MKTCSKCSQEKPLDGFYRNAKSKDGRAAQCKTCRNEGDRLWQARDKQRTAARNARWERKYPLKASIRKANYAGRARSTSTIPSDITNAWLEDLKRSTSDCTLCGVKLTYERQITPDRSTLDHIVPLFRGGTHSMANVRFVCHACNGSRPRTGAESVT